MFLSKSSFTNKLCFKAKQFKQPISTNLRSPSKPFLVSQTDQNLLNYCIKQSSPQPEYLQAIYNKTFDTLPNAHNMISPLQGILLSMLVSLFKPTTTLELGCYVGYSALCIAHGLNNSLLNNGAHIWTCEVNENIAKVAEENIQNSNYKNNITILKKSAMQVLQEWDSNKKIDFAFIDANKSGYLDYFNVILERNLLHQDGFIIADNTCFRAQVHQLDPTCSDLPIKQVQNNSNTTKNNSKVALHIYNFNNFVSNHPKVEQLLLPIFDGFTIIKLKN
ncbi:hypothetical protein BB561_006068 [Smittium simulii]|uniref:Catechol O-methyltransferase n=1 Tax=Smittium simulii TaxID=133385 RepID=A0A2T9Y6K9_9FUNG|nr:hypothetical protein BB561_006068 [Smittium simulii]